MTDNDLIRLLAGYLDAALASKGWTTFTVVQKDQPTQQGVPTTPTVFLQHLFDIPRGQPQSEYRLDTVAETFTTRESRITEMNFQISVLSTQDPEQPDMPTASDVVKYLHAYVNSRFLSNKLNEVNVGMARVTEIRNHPFEDDRDQFEYHPSFDLVLLYSSFIEFEEGIVTQAELKLLANVEQVTGT